MLSLGLTGDDTLSLRQWYGTFAHSIAHSLTRFITHSLTRWINQSFTEAKNKPVDELISCTNIPINEAIIVFERINEYTIELMTDESANRNHWQRMNQWGYKTGRWQWHCTDSRLTFHSQRCFHLVSPDEEVGWWMKPDKEKRGRRRQKSSTPSFLSSLSPSFSLRPSLHLSYL